MEIELSLEFLRVVEQAAIESAKTMGRGDGHMADQAAVEAMRRVMDEVPMDGTIVIGEGERDEAPMLFIGEKIGAAQHVRGFNFPAVDIAVDPLEGTNLCATGAPGSITVLAASEKGGLLHAPDLYMEKIIVGPSCKRLPSIWTRRSLTTWAPSPSGSIATSKIWSIIVLERTRHEKLIADIRATGARIRLIGDGDLSAGISAAVIGTGRARRHGHWRRARRRADCGGAALPEWRNSGASGGFQTRARRTSGERWESRTASASIEPKTWRPARKLFSRAPA